MIESNSGILKVFFVTPGRSGQSTSHVWSDCWSSHLWSFNTEQISIPVAPFSHFLVHPKKGILMIRIVWKCHQKYFLHLRSLHIKTAQTHFKESEPFRFLLNSYNLVTVAWATHRRSYVNHTAVRLYCPPSTTLRHSLITPRKSLYSRQHTLKSCQFSSPESRQKAR